MLGTLTRSSSVPGLDSLVGGLTKLTRSKSLNALDTFTDESNDAVQNRKDLRGCSAHDMTMKQVIATGSSSTVRICEHNPTRKVYAVKRISKQLVLQRKQVDSVKRERHIMFTCAHPFIVNLNGTFQDEAYVYMCLDYNEGGSVDFHLRQQGRFDESTVRFYTASIVLALEYLHNKGIVFRDLKPKNLMLDKHGYVKVCDFGLAKTLKPGKKTYTFCGTSAYQAPEMILNKGHHTAVDWWALGVVVFELLTGSTPFASINGDDVMATQTAILSGRVEYPLIIGKEAKDLISNMLVASKKKRLGHRGKGAREVRGHTFFKGFDFESLLEKQIPVPMTFDGPVDSTSKDESIVPDVPRLHRRPAQKDLLQAQQDADRLFADF